MNFFINNISFPLLDTRCDAGITIEVAVNDAIKKFPEFEKEIKLYYPIMEIWLVASFKKQ